ncbi:MAG TPA: ATP-binding cassette domain-containing protein, partial [Burkholderiaceae bacterium]|nr:ATP-binding cassette domain-containing protein [Burkholderiaceae bacterium]
MTALLEMRGITKAFPGVVALRDVNLEVKAGEIHAVVGENGAGKSTLMKVLSGVYPHGSYDGHIVFDGQERQFAGIADSERAGLVIIHQELALVPLLSIAENIFLGNERARGGVIDWFESFRATQALLKKVGLKAPPTTLVTDLGVGQQQLVEIAKALAKEVRLLILDEPTASLNETDSDALLELLLELKSHGIACILISHKLNEVAKVADTITVIRDGSTVATLDARGGAASEREVVRLMVGREMADRYPPRTPSIGDVVFEVKDWRVHHPEHRDRLFIKGVNFHARKGEIVGIAGLMGAGRTEFAMSVFGHSWGRRISGEVHMHGKPVDTSRIDRAVAHGLAYVTEDRKALGLVLDDSVAQNVTLANLAAISNAGVIDAEREFAVAGEYRRKLAIRCAGVAQPVVNLSGGNQQKVVLAKWLNARSRILILDHPTRGLDVGAKEEVYELVRAVTAEGIAVILTSDTLEETIGLSHTILVMRDGEVTQRFEAPAGGKPD